MFFQIIQMQLTIYKSLTENLLIIIQVQLTIYTSFNDIFQFI